MSEGSVGVLFWSLTYLGPIASQGKTVPIFQRKPIATCDFPGGEGCPDPLSLIWIRPCDKTTPQTWHLRDKKI